MNTEQLLLAILSSALLSAVLGGVIAGLFNLRAKRRDYENDYFKIVLGKRITAYEQLERLVIHLKTAVLDKDNRPYHLLFSLDDDSASVYKLLFEVTSQALWFTDEIFLNTRDLNYLLFRGNNEDGGLIEFGKQNYKAIASIREEIERILTKDMLSLHDVPAFLELKKGAGGGFHAVQLRS